MYMPVILSLSLIGIAAHPRILSNGILGPNQVIQSEILGYKLQYRVYIPEGYEAASDLPVVYMTDGQWYIESGQVHAELDRLIAARSIKPVIAVFVDNRDPDNLSDNRRNKQFFCNQNYADFFEKELIPEIDRRYKTAADRKHRVILGLSFGGLNSACFGLQAHTVFEGIAMQSPAMHPVPTLFSSYQSLEKLPLNIFLSTGTRQDNESRTRRFKKVLEEKGYDVKYVEVPFGHNWTNWKPLIDDVLLHYFGL
jgi:enterochelin esterase-like enzyme